MPISSTSVQHGNADPASRRHHGPGFAVASARRYKQEAVAILEQFLAAEELEVVHLTPRLFAQGFALYKSHQNKAWGLVDCISSIVMHEAGVTQALTFDQPFVQAGFQAYKCCSGLSMGNPSAAAAARRVASAATNTSPANGCGTIASRTARAHAKCSAS